MRLFTRLISGARDLMQRTRADREMHDELRDYLEHAVEQKMAEGLSAEEATRVARAQLGSAAAIKDRVRDVGWEATLESCLNDVGYALRVLRRNRGFAAIAVLTLGLGIGVNTAIFTFADGMLFRPLPFHNPDRLVMIQALDRKTGRTYTRVDRVDFEQLRSHGASLDGIAVVEQAQSLTWLGTDGAARISTAQGSPEMLDVLGVTPSLGRALHAGDELMSPRVAMLTHQAWQRRFGGDPSVVGRTITFDQGSVQIVGVLPRRFVFPLTGWLVEADLLLVSAPDEKEAADPRSGVWTPVARLKPGVALAQAQAEVDMLVGRAARQFPETRQDRALKVVELQFAMFELSRPTLWLLVGAAAFVVLIACANLASLLMARGSARIHELGVRAAIGAGRGRLIRQLLIESLVLAALGAAAALALASVAFRLLLVVTPARAFRLVPDAIDARAAVFALLAAVLSGLLFGILPAIRLSLPDLNSAMKRSVADRTAGTGLFRMGWLVAVEVALGIVLLCGAGLMVNTLVRMQSVDLGFDPSRVIALSVFPPVERYPTVDQRFAFQMDLLERVRRIPGVQVAGAIDYLPIGGAAPPRDLGKGMPSGVGLWSVAPGYFQTMSVTILQGRDFTPRDASGAVGVAVVNQAAAAILWPGEAAVGKLLRLQGSAPLEIVGLVKDARAGYGRNAAPAVYRPFSREGFRLMSIVVRANEPASLVSTAMRTEVQRIDPRLIVARPDTLESLLNDGVAGTRFQTTLFGLFAAVGLLLAGVGIYGVTAYWVTSRTHELGVRLALGADPGRLRLLVIGQAARPVLTGLAIGLLAAFALTRQLQALLYGVTPYDPLTVALASLLLVSIGLMAAYVPARRASQVDPLVALRAD